MADDEEALDAAPEPNSPFTLEFFVDEEGRRPVLEWLRGLSRTKRKVLGTAMREVLQHRGVGVCGTEFGKQLGQGLFEFRLRQKVGDVRRKEGSGKALPPEKILLRVFCHAHGNRIVLLLAGYDKGEAPSAKRQDLEIRIARARLKEWRSR